MSDLIEAVKKNDAGLVKELIGRGADLDGFDGWGCTALLWAADRGFECAELLLEGNADVEKANGIGSTPLHIATINGHAECVKLLIDWKANVNTKTNIAGSPLHFATGYGHFACVAMLIQAGAELDARDSSDFTPLAFALNNNKRDIAELLLDKGAKMSNVREDVEIPDWMGVIVAKRHNVKRGVLMFMAVLRKRFTVSGVGTEHIRGKLPLDIVRLLGRCVWGTRFDKRWMLAVPVEK